MRPFHRFSTDRLDDPLHDGRRFNAVQIRNVSGSGQQAAVVTGNFEAGQRFIDCGGQALQSQIFGENFQQMLDVAVQFYWSVNGFFHLFAFDVTFTKNMLSGFEA